MPCYLFLNAFNHVESKEHTLFTYFTNVILQPEEIVYLIYRSHLGNETQYIQTLVFKLNQLSCTISQNRAIPGYTQRYTLHQGRNYIW